MKKTKLKFAAAVAAIAMTFALFTGCNPGEDATSGDTTGSTSSGTETTTQTPTESGDGEEETEKTLVIDEESAAETETKNAEVFETVISDSYENLSGLSIDSLKNYSDLAILKITINASTENCTTEGYGVGGIAVWADGWDGTMTENVIAISADSTLLSTKKTTLEYNVSTLLETFTSLNGSNLVGWGINCWSDCSVGKIVVLDYKNGTKYESVISDNYENLSGLSIDTLKGLSDLAMLNITITASVENCTTEGWGVGGIAVWANGWEGEMTENVVAISADATLLSTKTKVVQINVSSLLKKFAALNGSDVVGWGVNCWSDCSVSKITITDFK